MTVNRMTRLTRITTGHGSSSLGISVLLNDIGYDVPDAFPNAKDGDLLIVEVRKPTEQELLDYQKELDDRLAKIRAQAKG